MKVRRAPSTLTGAEALIGQTVRPRVLLEKHTGRALLGGTWWRLRSPTGPMRLDATYRVTAMDGLTLLVEPVAEPAEPPGPDPDRTSTEGE
jgi:membrane protein implicated in regulation of membrane protease activity